MRWKTLSGRDACLGRLHCSQVHTCQGLHKKLSGFCTHRVPLQFGFRIATHPHVWYMPSDPETSRNISPSATWDRLPPTEHLAVEKGDRGEGQPSVYGTCLVT